jgi:hypothetical protein
MDRATDTDVHGLYFYGRVFFLLILTAWGIKFVFAPVRGDSMGSSFLHLINLPFHEAGHLIFSILGDFMKVLGGTLTQILIPLVCMVAFLRRQDAFAASCSLWWVGQNFIDVAPYIFDARAGELMLLGGATGQDDPDFHDWHNILERLGLLSWDHAIAYLSKSVGVLLILVSLGWTVYTLFQQYRVIKQKEW